ncbi:MAG: ParA family protein [Proteocatella sp.]
MTKVITFGVEKGGAAKTTTCGVVAYLLSRKKKVLVIDMDSQGNLTELLTGMDSAEFAGRSILTALQENDADKYTVVLNDKLHLLAGQTELAKFPRWLYEQYKGDKSLALRQVLDQIKDNYDYVLIDTPPALGDATINALAASDFVVALYEASKYCYSALGRFLSTAEAVKTVNPELKVAGIVTTLMDSRRADNKALLELVQEEYKDLCFKTVIFRRAATGRLSIYGFDDNHEIKQAVEQFEPLLKEIVKKCR